MNERAKTFDVNMFADKSLKSSHELLCKWLLGIVLLSLTGNEKDVTMHRLTDDKNQHATLQTSRVIQNVIMEPARGRLNRTKVWGTCEPDLANC